MILISALSVTPSLAQNSIPDMPDPIKNLADQGAQIEYMGRDNGFDSWLSVKNGQEQYFYVPPGGDGFVMGVLFDNKGRVVTAEQINRLRKEDNNLLDNLSGSALNANSINTPDDKRFEFKSPSERLFHETENTNWVSIGYKQAPVVYALIDPQCPHCHAMLNEINADGYLDRGALQLRLIPVGINADNKAQAAYLIATPNPQERLFKFLAGDLDALPVRDDINIQGVERNLEYVKSWKFDVTPMLVYRNKDGEVKIVRGKPQDIPAMLADLTPAR